MASNYCMSTQGLTTGPGAEKGLRPKPDHRILLRPPGSKPRIQEMRSSEKEKYFITEIDKNPNHNLLLPPARLQPVSHHCKLHFRRFDRPPDWKTKTLPRWQLWPSGSCRLTSCYTANQVKECWGIAFNILHFNHFHICHLLVQIPIVLLWNMRPKKAPDFANWNGWVLALSPWRLCRQENLFWL